MVMCDIQKMCPKCKQKKDYTSFSKSSKNKDGMQVYCKVCYSGYGKTDIARARERSRGTSPHRRKMMRLWNKTKAGLNSQLKSIYGINIEEYNRLFKEQNGGCAICNNPNVNDRRLCVDHSHITGKVRGLLCHRCNSALGLVAENVEILHSCINYLGRHRSN